MHYVKCIYPQGDEDHMQVVSKNVCDVITQPCNGQMKAVARGDVKGHKLLSVNICLERLSKYLKKL